MLSADTATLHGMLRVVLRSTSLSDKTRSWEALDRLMPHATHVLVGRG